MLWRNINVLMFVQHGYQIYVTVKQGCIKFSIPPSLGGGDIKFMGKNIKLERVGLGKQYPFFSSSLRSN